METSFKYTYTEKVRKERKKEKEKKMSQNFSDLINLCLTIFHMHLMRLHKCPVTSHLHTNSLFYNRCIP